MYKPVPSKYNPVLNEEQILNFWKLRRIFAKTSELHQGSAEFFCFEYPSSATIKPAVSDIQSQAVQDVYLRYRLMRGYHVDKRSSWGAHGLPVEIAVEKQLGIRSKSQIEAYGIDRFNALCRSSAFKYIQAWERFADRLASWTDMQKAGVTSASEMIESTWWILKTFWERGFLVQSLQVAPYCPRCGTPLSRHEASLGSRLADDRAVLVRMPLVDEPGTSLLVWTDQPWTLVGSVAVAADPEAEYALVRRGLPEGGSEKLIVARHLVEKVFADQPVAVLEAFKGKKLKGRRYHPLFTFVHPQKPAHFVILQDNLVLESGSGLVSIAPAFCGDGLKAAINNDLPILMTVAEDGAFIPEIRPWSGQFVKDSEPLIVEELQRRGLLFSEETITHSTPFCLYCGSALLHVARNVWSIRLGEHAERLIQLNQESHFVPSQSRNLGLKGWIDGDEEWIISRERFWGTPLPIWECPLCRSQIAVGSLEELSRLAGRSCALDDLHRPYIDQIQIPCPKCSGIMKRVPDVVDYWFDLGSIPAARWHFPFENRPEFRAHFPANFICEAAELDQSWFYSLQVVSALLFDSIAVQNIIRIGPVSFLESEKTSISPEKFADPWETLNQHGADALRWHFYTAAGPGQAVPFSPDLVGVITQEFFQKLWDIYASFITIANLDQFNPTLPASSDVDDISPPSPHGRNSGDASPPHSLLGSDTSDHISPPSPHESNARDASPAHSLLGSDASDDISPPSPHESNARDASPPHSLLGSDASNNISPPSPHGRGAGGEGFLLDRWLLSELSILIRDSTQAFEAYDVMTAAVLIQNFVDDMSQWYLPRSRRRFWKRGLDTALNSAYTTLHTTLLTLAHLLAPAVPFLAEVLYQNLQRTTDPAAPESVHLSRWPKFDPERIDERLNAEMRLAMRLASLGHSARNQAGVKAAQPLQEIVFQMASEDEAEAMQRYRDLIADGSSVRQVRLLGETAFHQFLVAQSLERNPGEVATPLLDLPGFIAAADGGYLAALTTALTPALIRAGLVGEVIQRVLDLRVKADLAITSPIVVFITATPGLWDAVQEGRELLQGETNAADIIQEKPPEGAQVAEAWFGGHWLKMGISMPSQNPQ